MREITHPTHSNLSAIHTLINHCWKYLRNSFDFPYAITYTTLMKTLSSTELRANLSAVMDRVNDDHEPVIVHRAKGKPVVMVSLEDWASMDETAYLLSSPANAQMLREGIAALNGGEGIVRTLIEE